MPEEISEAERRRRLLQKELEDFTGCPVYFQAPSSPLGKVRLSYPCVVYNLDDIESRFADNRTYTAQRRYQITFITHDPGDSFIDEFLNRFSQIRFNRHFTSDGLNHYIYSLYY